MVTPLIVFLAAALLTACGTAAPSTAPDPSADGRAPPTSGSASLQPSEGFTVDEIAFTRGERRIRTPVLVADSPALRSVGLMHRTELPENAGMLFVFEEPAQGAFWMKNTLLPLTIAFVGQDGTVRQLIDMDPCTADPCPRYEPREPYLYAVEANQGFFTANGIAAGWTLELGAEPGGGS